MFPSGGGMGGLPPGMDPAMMQRVQQVLTSNPEAMSLLQKPGVMEKLQRIQSDPGNAHLYTSDADVQRLMQILQSSGLGPSRGGMGASAPSSFSGPAYPGLGRGGSRGTPASTSAVSASSILKADGYVCHLSTDSSALFDAVLKEVCVSRRRLLVVDWFATWCGPCMRIAPELDKLAMSYRSAVTVLKVDVDKCNSLARQNRVTAMPTFTVYGATKKSKDTSVKLAETKGADLRKLEELIDRHLADLSTSDARTAQFSDSPYAYFPVTKPSLPVYSKCPFGKMKKALASIGADSELTAIVDVLSDKSSYHSASLSVHSVACLRLLLQKQLDGGRPVVKHCAVLLDILRMAALHPSFAALFVDDSKGVENNWLSLLTAVATDTVLRQSVPVMRTLLRVFINLFSRNPTGSYLMRALTQRATDDEEEDGDSVSVSWCDALFNAYLLSDKPLVRSAFAQVVLCAAYYNRQTAVKSELTSFTLMHFIAESVAHETDASVMAKLLIALGTCVFRNEASAALVTMFGTDKALQVLLNGEDSAKVISASKTDSAGVELAELITDIFQAIAGEGDAK